MTLDEYLAEAERKPLRFGGGASGFDGDDCFLFPSNWVLAACGKDPAAGFRGTYGSKDEARRLLDRFNGVEALVGSQMASVGWYAADEATDGDVAVVEAPVGSAHRQGLIPAIRHAGLWLIRTKRGRRAFDFPAKAIWTKA